jgi:beta-lactamase class A
MSPKSPLAVLTVLFFLLGGVSARADGSLGGQVEHYIKGLRAKGQIARSDRTAWLVHDLTGGIRLVSINESMPMQAASMIKPLLALAFFHQVKAGRLSYGPTSRRHMELMIQKSNNASTNWVMRQTGGPAETKALLARHYPSVCRQLRLVEYIPTDGWTYRNFASASDYAAFLTALWQKRLPYADEMLRLMGLPGPDRLVDKARRVPAGTGVYNKTGSTAMCCGDMGILVARGTNGRSYPYLIIGIIDSTVRVRSYNSWISNRSNVIREVSNLTYQAMKEHYPLR